MEAERKRKLTRRNPLSDCTNTSSSSVSLNPTKPNPYSSSSSSALKKPTTKCTPVTRIATNLDNASNPTSPLPTVLSTPSPKTSSLNGTVDLEASEPFSAIYSRRSFSNIRKDKGKEVAIPVRNTPFLNKRKDKGKEVEIPVSNTPVLNKRKDKGKEVAIPVSNTPILKVSDYREKNVWIEGANLPKAKALTDPCRKKHCAVTSEQDVFQDPDSNKRKDKGKEVAIPVSSTPILKVSDSRERNYEVEGENLPKTKALTVPCRKKHRATFKDPLLQDYIEKQKAYFKMIDEFELPEEEVESINQLE